MCGISGYYSSKDQATRLSNSIAAIAHRGPDSYGEQNWNSNGNTYVGLGHVRLSIIDLTVTGNQPMVSHDNSLVMVFNGEIYNYKELRERLTGHHFIGRSDSEVLIEYYRRFGTSGLSSLRGMFAIAFYEVSTGRLVLVRDQIGVKPLYYARQGRECFFSSEIRGLRPFMDGQLNICQDALFEFMSCGFVFEPNTGFSDIQKIPAGHYAVMHNGEFSLHQYFDIQEESRKATYSDDMISTAIKEQMDSDAALGIFYSGGLDSSVIAAIARKPSLFVQYMPDDITLSGVADDEPYAIAIAEVLKLDMRKVQLSANRSDPESIIRSMRAVAEGTEELISDYTYFASSELSKAARDDGFKVMLSGMGGDELFLGYPRYRLVLGGKIFRSIGLIAQWSWIRSIIRRIPSLAKKIDRFASFYSEKTFALSYMRLLGYFCQRELRDLLGNSIYDDNAKNFIEKCNRMLKGFEFDPPIVRAMVLDFHGFLSHNLIVADKSSMRVGLELRVPLLDQDLYCGYLSALRNKSVPLLFGKTPLKNLLRPLLADSLVNRKKTAFNPPLDGKINALGEIRILEILRSGNIGSVLSLPVAESIVRIHFNSTENNSYKIWQLLYLSFWLDINFQKD